MKKQLNKSQFIWILICSSGICFSCSPKNVSSRYYYENEKALDRIEKTYRSLYRIEPFTVGFTDKEYRIVSLEIIKDTVSYINEFNIDETLRLADTLKAYKLNAGKISALIKEMNAIRCTWINQADFYVDEKKQSLIYLSIKPVAQRPLSSAKYYILTYFEQPQYYDKEGNLLDKKTVRRIRKFKGDSYKRINSKVAYTVSGTFR